MLNLQFIRNDVSYCIKETTEGTYVSSVNGQEGFTTDVSMLKGSACFVIKGAAELLGEKGNILLVHPEAESIIRERIEENKKAVQVTVDQRNKFFGVDHEA